MQPQIVVIYVDHEIRDRRVLTSILTSMNLEKTGPTEVIDI